jgi:hypothetical protein
LRWAAIRRSGWQRPAKRDETVLTVAQTLPFGELTCRISNGFASGWRARATLPFIALSMAKRAKRRGGIDTFVRRQSGRYDARQVKRRKRFSATDVKDAVDRFLAGEWASETGVFRLTPAIKTLRCCWGRGSEEFRHSPAQR